MSKPLRCLFISQFAPTRTQTDPHTGLPWYLSQLTRLTGVWNKPERGVVGFKSNCENVIEVTPGINGWLKKALHLFKMATDTLKPDVLLCGVDEHSLSLGVLMSKIARVPVFAFAEDPPFTNRYNGFPPIRRRVERALRRETSHMFLRRCSGIFCFVEKEALKDVDVRGVPLYQMMNGPSEKAMAWLEENPRVADKDDGFVVGLVGALCKDQGLDTILEIIAEANKRTEGLKLRLIGPMDPAHEEAFYAQARRLRLHSLIEVTGWLPYPMMLEKLSGCSFGLYCNPETEWFHVAQPLKICEYLALEKPVIAWDYPGVRRLLDHGRLGSLVPPGNLSAFVDAVVQMSDRAFREPVVREIRKAVKGHWSNGYWYQQVLTTITNTTQGANDESGR